MQHAFSEAAGQVAVSMTAAAEAAAGVPAPKPKGGFLSSLLGRRLASAPPLNAASEPSMGSNQFSSPGGSKLPAVNPALGLNQRPVSAMREAYLKAKREGKPFVPPKLKTPMLPGQKVLPTKAKLDAARAAVGRGRGRGALPPNVKMPNLKMPGGGGFPGKAPTPEMQREIFNKYMKGRGSHLVKRGVLPRGAMGRLGTALFEIEQQRMLKKAERQPRFAFVSQLTQGYLSVDLPPHKKALFAHADAAVLGSSGVFSFAPDTKGHITSHGIGAQLNLCEVGGAGSREGTTPTSASGVTMPGFLLPSREGKAFQLCAATPSHLKPPPATALPGKAERHRRLLLSPPPFGPHAALSHFIVEVVQ